MTSLTERAAVHAALGDPVRLAIVDDLACSDRSPVELTNDLDIPSNLLAHHLDVLERAGVIERFASSGDKRRRYVRLRRSSLAALGVTTDRVPGRVVFVCTHNSARSQLAAALWRERTGRPARSAGTHPAPRVHAGAVAAAERAGLDLGAATPSRLDAVNAGELVVTVCDRAHEELHPPSDWWHWSIPDPVEDGSDDAFDRVVADLDARIATIRPDTIRQDMIRPDTSQSGEERP